MGVYEYAHRLLKWAVCGPPWVENEAVSQHHWSDEVLAYTPACRKKRYWCVHHTCGNPRCMNVLHMQWVMNDAHMKHHEKFSYGVMPEYHAQMVPVESDSEDEEYV